jgi:hypothetical protein
MEFDFSTILTNINYNFLLLFFSFFFFGLKPFVNYLVSNMSHRDGINPVEK